MCRLKPNGRLSEPQQLAALNSKREKKERVGATLTAVIIGPLGNVTLYPLHPQEAVSAATDEERLVKIHNVIQQLPPPHYRSSLKLCGAPWWPEVELFGFRKRKRYSCYCCGRNSAFVRKCAAKNFFFSTFSFGI